MVTPDSASEHISFDNGPSLSSSNYPAKSWVLGIDEKVLWIVIAALLCLTLGPRLFRSFWVDEAGTFWMAQGGPLEAIHKTWQWPGQSVLYAFIESFFQVNNGVLREFVLRLPTLVSAIVAYYFIYRLAEDALGKASGLTAVVLFAFHPLTLQIEAQARPYGPAMAAVIASCWALNRWVVKRENRILAGYIVSSALVVYFHYFFAVIFLAHACYLLYVFLIDRQSTHWKRIIGAYLAIGILVCPLWPHMRLLLREAHTLPFVAPPTIPQLTEFLLPSLLIFGALTAALIVQFFFPNALRKPPAFDRSFLVLLFAWWLLGPAIFFLTSVATPMRVFIARYMTFAVPAQALILAYIGFSVFGPASSRVWALLAVLLSTGSPLSMIAGRKVGYEELMPFMRVIKAESVKANPPVFYSSPLPESNFYDWKDGLSGTARLFAPFVVYPMPNKLLPLPYWLTDEVKADIQDVVRKRLREQREVLFVTHEPQSWNAWMIAELKQAGFSAKVVQPNGYSVTIFTR